MAGPALPRDHDRADLGRRPDGVALGRRVLVPVAGVAVPRHVALGRHVVRAPADGELVVDVRAEAAPDDLHRVRAACRVLLREDLPQRGRRRELPALAARNDEGHARRQRRDAQAVEVDDGLGVNRVLGRQGADSVGCLRRHDDAVDGRDDDLIAGGDRSARVEVGVRPANLLHGHVVLGRDRGQGLAGGHCVRECLVADGGRRRDRYRLDDRAVAAERNIA